jgi:hypothetical protein
LTTLRHRDCHRRRQVFPPGFRDHHQLAHRPPPHCRIAAAGVTALPALDWPPANSSACRDATRAYRGPPMPMPFQRRSKTLAPHHCPLRQLPAPAPGTHADMATLGADPPPKPTRIPYRRPFTPRQLQVQDGPTLTRKARFPSQGNSLSPPWHRTGSEPRRIPLSPAFAPQPAFRDQANSLTVRPSHPHRLRAQPRDGPALTRAPVPRPRPLPATGEFLHASSQGQTPSTEWMSDPLHRTHPCLHQALNVAKPDRIWVLVHNASALVIPSQSATPFLASANTLFYVRRDRAQSDAGGRPPMPGLRPIPASARSHRRSPPAAHFRCRGHCPRYRPPSSTSHEPAPIPPGTPPGGLPPLLTRSPPKRRRRPPSVHPDRPTGAPPATPPTQPLHPLAAIGPTELPPMPTVTAPFFPTGPHRIRRRHHRRRQRLH